MTIAILGEAIIDFIPNTAGTYRACLGGSPYNVTLGLARQGESVSYLSPFSDDSLGERLHANLREAGAQTPLARRSRYPTSIALIATDANGEPTYRLYRDGIADDDISFAEIKAHLPSDLTLLHTGSLALTPNQLPKVRELLQLMNDRSIPVSLDLNIRLCATLDTTAYLHGVRALLPFADIVKASNTDLVPLQLAADAEQAAQVALQEMGSGMLILTQGKKETVLLAAGCSIKQATAHVAKVQDTVGAGDSFYAAFLAYLSRNQLCRLAVIRDPIGAAGPATVQAALAFANAAAAINVSRVGCSPATREEVEQFMARQTGA
tara:strand:- start:6164 stop:7129 length:966 start_codon:yes stop_codon:yes gene_type:complete